MVAFGLKTKDAAFLLDTLNVVNQKTGVNMDTLSTTIVSNAATLQQLGFSASYAAFFLGNVEISGANTPQVMGGLTKSLANTTSRGVPLKTALSNLQKGMVNANTDTEGLKIAYELFGKKAG